MSEIIIGESVTQVVRKTIEAVMEHGVKVHRKVGSWCMMKEGEIELTELHNVVLMIKNPLKRWNSRVTAGMLVEIEDYFLGLNPGFTHLSPWKFYNQWRTVGMEKYPYTYGGRIHGENEQDINQFEECVKLLRSNSTTRHANVTIQRPVDVLRDFQPCNVWWHFQINDEGKLCMTTICRSQDALRGLFLDCFAYTHYLEQMCLATGLPMGSYTVFETNVHIYAKDYDKVETSFGKPTEPYTSGIKPSKAQLLSDKYKRIMFEASKIMFEEKKMFGWSVVKGLPTYWKDWKYFQAMECMNTHLKVVCPDIQWTIQERMKQLERRR